MAKRKPEMAKRKPEMAKIFARMLASESSSRAVESKRATSGTTRGRPGICFVIGGARATAAKRGREAPEPRPPYRDRDRRAAPQPRTVRPPAFDRRPLTGSSDRD
eukprot:427609-Prorocentrum_minimum.AAC.1